MAFRHISWLPFFSCFDKSQSSRSDHELAEAKEPLVRQDELSKKLADNQEKRVMMRVRVKMTKEEARRLVSKCKDSGLLEFRDVACELARIPVSRVSVEPMPARGVYHTAPESIPEEDDTKEW
ncbi:hypothetical protein BT93_D1953 [Corymbia citriodora subsp. variegata]|nr:hypothetical protein BT93_D1953 [Corymbia citriodora subsp. variegata]